MSFRLSALLIGSAGLWLTGGCAPPVDAHSVPHEVGHESAPASGLPTSDAAPAFQWPGVGNPIQVADSLRVRISSSDISVDGERVLTLGTHEEQVSAGVGAMLETEDGTLVVEELAKALQASGTTTAVIEAEKDVPHRVLVETALTIRHARQTLVALVGGVDSDQREIGAQLDQVESNEALFVALLVTDGISLKYPGGNVSPGCDAIGSGLAISLADGRYDFPALSQCVAKVNQAVPAPVEACLVLANPDVSYEQVLKAILAAKSAGCQRADLGFIGASGVPQPI